MSSQIKESRFTTEQVALTQLKPHPKNYQKHPDDEIEHIIESIRTHGFYRNIVIAEDGTILAGHGVVEAARRLGYTHVPVVRTAYTPDDPYALKLLIGDNEIRHLAEVDDRALTELLRELKDVDELLGTGYDEMMLANLVMVSRPASEITDLDAAAQWVGMPEYDMAGGPEARAQILVNFENEEARREFCQKAELKIDHGEKRVTVWWPAHPKNDTSSVRFTDNKDD